MQSLPFSSRRIGARSKAKFLEWLRGFFQYAVNREWIQKSPVSRDLKPPRGAARVTNKVPFTDEQLEDIIKACDQVEFRENWGNRWGTGYRSGDDLKDFIWTLTYTGLRISDVVLFDMERVHGKEVFLRAKKNGGDVFTLIPDWLRERLHARARRYGCKPFLTGKAKSLDTTIDLWRRHLTKVFALADVGTEPSRCTSSNDALERASTSWLRNCRLAAWNCDTLTFSSLRCRRCEPASAASSHQGRIAGRPRTLVGWSCLV